MTATQIRISSGRLVDLNDFKPEDICPMSIERSLKTYVNKDYKKKKPQGT